MRCIAFITAGVSALAVIVAAPAAQAASCPGNPHALGTSRVMTVAPASNPRIGSTQYARTLPLDDREVMLTFDDGPIRPYSEAVLRALAAECVKATYFLVGRQAEANPDLVRKIAQAGHTIGTHSQNHPLTFDQMPFERSKAEIDDGIAAVTNALGDAHALAPYFRSPGLLKTPQMESYLAARGIALWSTDFDADDWYRTATPADIVRKAMSRLETKGRGILLLHDVQPATAMAVPMLLRELKARGYRIVHAVPDTGRPAMVAERLLDRNVMRPQGERNAPPIAILPPPRPVIVDGHSFEREWRTGSVRTSVQHVSGGRYERGGRDARITARTTTRVIRTEPPRQQQARPRYTPTINYPWARQQPPRIADRGWDMFRR